MIKKMLLFTVVFIGACTSPSQVDTEDVVKYDEAYSLYSEAKNESNSATANELFDDAITAFRVVIDEYPWSSKVDNSYYYIGYSYDKKEPTEKENAIEAFRNVPPKSPQYDEAQRKISLLEGGN